MMSAPDCAAKPTFAKVAIIYSIGGIMGRAVSEDGTELLALDYSRIVPVLHGALLSVIEKLEAALDRISAM